jgi:hypothetical protein
LSARSGNAVRQHASTATSGEERTYEADTEDAHANGESEDDVRRSQRDG